MNIYLIPYNFTRYVVVGLYTGGAALMTWWLTLFVISFIVLGYLGTKPPSTVLTLLAQIFTVIYFLFFLLMPIYSKFDKTKPEPERLT